MRILSEIASTLLSHMKNTRFTIRRFFISLIISNSLLTLSYADEIALTQNPPEKYVVVKGDTLWDIAGKFLKHPWQWPELWKKNTQIKNPHLIYPKDTIYFQIIGGKPQLSLTHFDSVAITDKPCILKPSEYEKGRDTFLLDKNNKVLPCMRESELEKPITLIPHDKIAAFLTSPKVVTEDELNDAPYVVGFREGRLLAGTGDKVYVKNLVNITANTYTIYREGETYRDPHSNDVLGIEAIYMASATLAKNGDPATLIITNGTHEIRTGDRVMPSPEIENTLNFFPKPPQTPVDGHIVGVKDGMALIGLYSVVVVDKGTAEGLQSGHELTVYQKGKNIIDSTKDKDETVQLPDEEAGKIMIFRPFEHISYALVMKATHDIHRGDEVKTQ